MECGNRSQLTHFILVGLPYPPALRVPLFLFFLLIYLLTLCGNLLVLLAVVLDRHLHKPMYWFLCHLSFIDVAVSSVVVPKVVATFLPGGGDISFQGCVAQLFFFHFLGCTECLLYTVMAYDRVLAIYNPLRYGVIMNRRACLCLAAGTWLVGSIHSTIQTLLTLRLHYGRDIWVGYIFCDVLAVLKLACGDTALNEMVAFGNIGFLAITLFLLILTSYVCIISAILRIRSFQGRHRAFSTCVAHVTVVFIYCVPLTFTYFRPGSQHPLDSVVAVFYTTVTPFLNPLIYTLRNQEMKAALMRLVGHQKTAGT
ncbi:olfactory receptor 10G6-like [Carettochelys insculpta]|uniref:olfactory receptor 10G6-like n=1 Tax=Carettochelys insculpta TaxID=44489 RepID=UPI003EB95C74